MTGNEAGTKLAKVLWYYNLIPSTASLSQKIVCPFHKDVNPSMIVNLEDGSWFCFGCNLTGDAIKFVKLMEAQHNGLNDLQAYRKYLQILKSDKCSDIVINPSLKLNKPIQRDLYNDNKKFKGWVCRTMVKSVEEKRKYLYNEGFSRATTLVGTYGTKDYVFVVEGYMDRLKFVQFGEDNVVAILGWKMSPQQIQKLKDKGITKVISALDNDDCGKKGTEFLKKHFEVTRFTYLKGVKDPGEMTQETFDKMLKRTMKNFK